MSSGRKIIVISPVKNEAWIITEFLDAASEFADHIILGDHSSTDETVAIASKNSKVIILSSKQSGFEEAVRRNELLEEARKLGRENVVLAIDADELLDPRFVAAGGIEELRRLPVGTRIFFPHFNLKPDGKSYWRSSVGATGFIDDGCLHPETDKIHFPRIPSKPGFSGASKEYRHKFGGLIHLQYLNWERLVGKTRWYKSWESVCNPDVTTLQIRRRYSHIDRVLARKSLAVPKEWFDFLKKIRVDKATQRATLQTRNWWDDAADELIKQIPVQTLLNLALNPDKGRPLVLSKQPKGYEWRLSKYLRLTQWLEKNSDYILPRLALRTMDRIFDVLSKDKK